MEEMFDVFGELLNDDSELEDVINIVEPQRDPRIFHVRVSMNNFTEEEFVERFRISKQSAQFILDRIGHLLERNTDQFKANRARGTSLFGNNDDDCDAGPLVRKGEASTSAITMTSRNTTLCDSRENISKNNLMMRNGGAESISQPTSL